MLTLAIEMCDQVLLEDVGSHLSLVVVGLDLIDGGRRRRGFVQGSVGTHSPGCESHRCKYIGAFFAQF